MFIDLKSCVINVVLGNVAVSLQKLISSSSEAQTLSTSQIQETLTKVKDWDKAWANKIQEKFKLTDYQMLCLAFGKGFILGALIL